MIEILLGSTYEENLNGGADNPNLNTFAKKRSSDTRHCFFSYHFNRLVRYHATNDFLTIERKWMILGSIRA